MPCGGAVNPASDDDDDDDDVCITSVELCCRLKLENAEFSERFKSTALAIHL